MWNKKFDREDFLYGTNPNIFIKENVSFLKPRSRVICLGEGEGRNALYLAKEGFRVEALDASDVGLMKLQKKALEEETAITIRHTLIENWEPHGFYDGIICSFMHLPKSEQKDMFLKSFLSLQNGGYFIAEFFSVHQLQFQSGGPKDENLLYDLKDLYTIFSNLPCKIYKLSEEITTLDEGAGHNGEASVIRVIIKKERQVLNELLQSH